MVAKRSNMYNWPLFYLGLISLLFGYSCTSVSKSILNEHTRINRTIILNGTEVKDGLWAERYDSGTIEMSFYKKGLKEGKSKIVSGNGEIVTAEYKNNILNGWKRFFRKDGVVYMEIFYQNGKEIKQNTYSPAF